MARDLQNILDILNSELEFIEKGGYRFSPRQDEGTLSTIFADSPTCLNYGYPYRLQPCGECPLMEFVPEDGRVSLMPCHRIPLNSSGQTIESMEETGKPTQMQEAVKTWLRETIRSIESQRSA